MYLTCIFDILQRSVFIIHNTPLMCTFESLSIKHNFDYKSFFLLFSEFGVRAEWEGGRFSFCALSEYCASVNTLHQIINHLRAYVTC